MEALTSRIRPRALGQRALLHLLLLSTAFLVFLPYLWMVTTSLKPLKLTFQPPFLIPEHFEWHNYADAWNAAPFDRFYVNSMIMAAAIAVGQVLTSAMAAYAFERLEFPLKNTLFFVFLGTLMIPLPLLLIPSYVIVERFGWLNTFYALIVPRLWTPFGILLMRQYFRTLPRELDEAAMTDGSTRIGVLFRVLLPLSRPAVATLGLFAFLFAWNDFLWPLIMLDNPDRFTIQLGLANFAGKYGTQWVQLMAGTVTATLPVLVFFLFVQRWIIRGLTMGAINE
jgi:multiple sugar transport system permease protein